MRSENRLLLIAVATNSSDDDSETYARSVAAELEGKAPEYVLRFSRRAYPAIILADDDLWIQLEKEPQANMALSPEESEVLESARRSERPFPLFINGRAGSGKSTILQYLFADLLFFYLTKTEQQTLAPPLYLTANGELLRVARTFVEKLLKTEAAFVQQGDADAVGDFVPVLESAFRQFQPHLLSLVAHTGAAPRYAPSGRVDYSRFRNHWMLRFGKDQRARREFGPDLSWHVIRSYIKGMSSETYLEPDDYAQLPENQITVTTEAFRLVYDRVWSWYRELLEEHSLWDDQDLARFVLENELAAPIHPAVFCDEAQDFTRIELELVLRLSLFSDRTLAPNQLSRVPFVFAGDPFQTLNPTGFRWDAIKASFVEKFIFELDPARRSGRTDLNYRELQHNYRSTHQIVRFGNEVQALRAALFQLPDLRPQLHWTEDQASLPVVWYRSSDAQFWKKYAEEKSAFVLIVPCNEGEEADFVRNDAVLRDYVEIVDGVPQFVLSASRAKGCEYPAVIVYGFGDKSPIDVTKEIADGAESMTRDVDDSLPMQYFINRLYVAVSRPKQRLVVVDSDEGLKKLWAFAQDQASEAQLLRLVKNGTEIWQPQITGMSAGTAGDIARQEADDPAETAAIYEQQGHAQRDAYYFTQAAQAYRIAGNNPKARECSARALEAQGNYLEAGKAFWDAGFVVPDAVTCLWRAGKEGWRVLAHEAPRDPSASRQIEFRWAHAIINGTKPGGVVEILDDFVRQLRDDSFASRVVGDSAWRAALEALFASAVKTIGTFPADVKQSLVHAMDEIRARRVPIPNDPFAVVYAASGKYAESIALWDEIGATKSPEYAKAKAATEPYPLRLVVLGGLKQTDAIITDFESNRSVLLTVEQSGIVIDALRQRGRYRDAVQVAWTAELAMTMAEIALHAFDADAKDDAEFALQACLPLFIREGRWDVVAGVASEMRFAPRPNWNTKALREWVTQNSDALRVAMVKGLARPSDVAQAPAPLKKQIQDFLRSYLRVKKPKWHGAVSFEEAGASIERADRFIDAITFYEAVPESGAFTKDQRLLAQHRWLVCKGRQLKYEGDPRTVARARDIQREISQRMASLRVQSLADLPEFPNVGDLTLETFASLNIDAPPIVEPVSPTPVVEFPVVGGPVQGPVPDTVEMMLGPMKLEVSRSLGRCIITDSTTMDIGFIKVKERECGGSVDFSAAGDGSWHAEKWDLDVRFPEKAGHRVMVSFGRLGITLQIDSVSQENEQ